LVVVLFVVSCKKDKLTTDPSATVRFSQDSVLFDTVFTTIGSSTRNIRIVNDNNQKINISSIQLQSGGTSGFKLNVDGLPGTSFSDIEIAAHDSIYVFIQVNVNPTNQNSPLIITDKINVTVNGNSKSLKLEAWGQDAYYHRPTNVIKFKDGSYLPYSTISTQSNVTVTWPNDKPHVIYGYLVVDEGQKLIINAGTRVYLNYKAGLWVYKYGELKVLGQKGNEVFFQGARREADYADEPGQWDRIWINEGSVNNVIDYAVIKNGFVGIQAEPLDTIGTPARLKLTNTKIQNMSKWGLYSVGFNIYAANNVISNCQEHSLNILLGGTYTFLHCTFANFWEKQGVREKATVNINNYYENNVFPMDSAYFGNCIIDGKREEELIVDVHTHNTYPTNYTFSSSWLKSSISTSDASKFIDVRKSSSSLNYASIGAYNFEPSNETGHKNFGGPKTQADAQKVPLDLNGNPRTTVQGSVSAGAYN
jgi:hypothetical protein